MITPEGQRLLGRQRRRLEDNIEMYLRETGSDVGNWIDLVQDSYQCMNLRISVDV